MKDKCKWVNGKLKGCSDIEYNFARNHNKYYAVKTSTGSYGFKTEKHTPFICCPFCGEPLKEPMPEKIEPIFNKCDHHETLYNHVECIESINKRIDYILERLEKC